MTQQKEKTPLAKKSKETYSFTLSKEIVSKFNDKIGYCSRSQIIENLISDYVNDGNALGRKDPKDTARKTNVDQEQEVNS